MSPAQYERIAQQQQQQQLQQQYGMNSPTAMAAIRQQQLLQQQQQREMMAQQYMYPDMAPGAVDDIPKGMQLTPQQIHQLRQARNAATIGHVNAQNPQAIMAQQLALQQQAIAQGSAHPPAAPNRPPMYQPGQIKNLPFLGDDEKTKYEQGLRGLWTKMNGSPTNSPDQIAARQNIIEFTRMLVRKIQQRRSLSAQQQAQQQPEARP
ncbi:hypothetical protein HDV63DRAFT_382182 [Trichoderma sp. SZMC 28014]